MNKQTQNLLLIGGGLALAYYLWKQSPAGQNAAIASTASNINSQLNTMFANPVLGSAVPQ